MLKKVNGEQDFKKISGEQNIKKTSSGLDPEKFRTPIGNAAFPCPFKSGLEFGAPAHGVWNIVHTGMLIPQSHQIYVCSPNCMRGVVLTAAEMNALERFSQVVIREKDVLAGSVEELTIEGVADVLGKLPSLPKAALVFTVCVHHFLGCDLDYIFNELEKRFPDVRFVRCYMDPIMKKTSLSPDEKMRRSLYEAIEPLPPEKNTVALLGSDFALDEESDIKVLLKRNGFTLKEITTCKTYEDYLSIGESGLFISCYPSARVGADALAERLKRPHLHLPLSFDFDEIEEDERRLAGQLGFEIPDDFFLKGRTDAEDALFTLKEEIGGTPVAIDYTFHPRPLGLARLLCRFGFNVKQVYLDQISAEEERDFYFLKENMPDLTLCATTRPECRTAHEKNEEMLCLGQKAAWFNGSPHFVNIVEGGGLYGFSTVRTLAEQMRDAFENEKEPKDLITMKGLGCESCVLI